MLRSENWGGGGSYTEGETAIFFFGSRGASSGHLFCIPRGDAWSRLFNFLVRFVRDIRWELRFNVVCRYRGNQTRAKPHIATVVQFSFCETTPLRLLPVARSAAVLAIRRHRGAFMGDLIRDSRG